MYFAVSLLRGFPQPRRFEASFEVFRNLEGVGLPRLQTFKVAENLEGCFAASAN